MKINPSLRWVRPARITAVVVAVGIAAMAAWHLARPYCGGGSTVTNVGANATAQVVAGLRIASR